MNWRLVLAVAFVFGSLLTAGLLAQGPSRDIEVQLYKGKPTVFVDRKPYPLAGFNTFGKDAFDRSMSPSYQQKFSVYFIAADTAAFWKGDRIGLPLPAAGPDAFDLDAQAGHILRGDPDGYLIVRFTATPPAGWLQLHPLEYFVNPDESRGKAPSLASDVYYKQANEFAAAVVRYCESRPWANRVIAYASFGSVEAEGTHEDVGSARSMTAASPWPAPGTSFSRRNTFRLPLSAQPMGTRV